MFRHNIDLLSQELQDLNSRAREIGRRIDEISEELTSSNEQKIHQAWGELPIDHHISSIYLSWVQKREESLQTELSNLNTMKNNLREQRKNLENQRDSLQDSKRRGEANLRHYHRKSGTF